MRQTTSRRRCAGCLLTPAEVCASDKSSSEMRHGGSRPQGRRSSARLSTRLGRREQELTVGFRHTVPRRQLPGCSTASSDRTARPSTTISPPSGPQCHDPSHRQPAGGYRSAVEVYDTEDPTQGTFHRMAGRCLPDAVTRTRRQHLSRLGCQHPCADDPCALVTSNLGAGDRSRRPWRRRSRPAVAGTDDASALSSRSTLHRKFRSSTPWSPA